MEWAQFKTIFLLSLHHFINLFHFYNMQLVFISFILFIKGIYSGYAINGEILEDALFSDEFNGKFRYSYCDGLKQPVILLKKLQVVPNSFYIPQNISMTIYFKVLKNIEPPIKVKINISKHLGFMGYLKLPCIANYGSCYFQRICYILENYPQESFAYKVTCPKWLRKSGVNCTCPINEGYYGVDNVRVPLESSIVPKWIATGDYKASLLIEGGNLTVGCFKFQFRIT